MSATYRLVLTGQFLPGAHTDHATAALAKLLRLEIERTQSLLANAPTVIKKALPHSQLDTYLKLFEQTGVEVKAEAITASPAVNSVANPLSLEPIAEKPAMAMSLEPVVEQITCPQCSKVQAKRTLCLGCGADMPRMFAAQTEASITSAPVQPQLPSQSTTPSQRRSRFDPEYETPAFWSLSTEGRLGRMRYLCNCVLAFLPLFAVLLIAVTSASGSSFSLFWITMFLASLAWALIQNYRMLVFRLHDLNKPTKYAGWIIFAQMVINGISRSSHSVGLILFVSVISFIISGVLAFAKGDEAENDYGLPAEPPNIFHYIAGAIGTIILVAMIIKTSTMDDKKPVTAPTSAAQFSDEQIDQFIELAEQRGGQKVTREQARQLIQSEIDKRAAEQQ